MRRTSGKRIKGGGHHQLLTRCEAKTDTDGDFGETVKFLLVAKGGNFQG